MTSTIILVILIALVLIYLVFRSAGKKSAKTNQKGNETASTGENGTSSANGATGETTSKDEIPGEVLTAIFMALHEEQEIVHDYENTVLTMDRVVRNYSPWNSKFYGLRQLPRR